MDEIKMKEKTRRKAGIVKKTNKEEKSRERGVRREFVIGPV